MSIGIKIFYLFIFCYFIGNFWFWLHQIQKELNNKKRKDNTRLRDLIWGTSICTISFIIFIYVIINNYI